MTRALTQGDVGKVVVDSEGRRVGIVEAVEEGRASVELEQAVRERVISRPEGSNNTKRVILRDDDISITDETIRIPHKLQSTEFQEVWRVQEEEIDEEWEELDEEWGEEEIDETWNPQGR